MLSDEIYKWAMGGLAMTAPVVTRLRRRKGAAALCTAIAALSLCLVSAPTFAQDSPELVQPPVCSAATAGKPEYAKFCTVTPLHNGHNEIKLNLTAKTTLIDVGGYKVTTENYGNYLTPVVEALPGDTVAAHLENQLTGSSDGSMTHMKGGMAHGDATDNPTNLHYFHGGIVSPNNAWPKPAKTGNGDNIYVYLQSGKSFDFSVPIPGEGELDGRVLESTNGN